MRAALVHLATAAAAVAVVAVLGWLLARTLDDYTARILIVVCIDAILVTSMGLANGLTGVFSLGHVGFVAVGAYTSGILSLPVAAKASFLPHLPVWLAHWSLPLVPATFIAGLTCVVLALIVGAPLMRLSGHYVSVATLGFLVIVNVVLVNANDYTRGARTFAGVPLETTLPWAAGWMAITVVLLARIAYSPAGRAMRAVREDTIAAQAVGIAVLPTRLAAFAVGAFFAGVGGSLYGHYLGSFSPASFYFAYTFALISMLVIGGMRSLSGALLGVVVVIALSESLRNLERGFALGPVAFPPLYGASQIVLGLMFILIMIFRPNGLLGDRELFIRPALFALERRNQGKGAAT